ncbi:MAG: hypothetical protein QM500_10795 [Methylococcales bacterium]
MITALLAITYKVRTRPKHCFQNLSENLSNLVSKLKTQSYRSSSVKRAYILKSNGKQRPLGMPTIEDKVVQQSVSQILQRIWGGGFSSQQLCLSSREKCPWRCSQFVYEPSI